MSDPKKVLWISYFYPPLFCGVGRQVKVAKYLPKCGWLPLVLTVKDSAFHPFIDASRIKDIPPGVEVHRTRSLESRLLYSLGKSLQGPGPTGQASRSHLAALLSIVRPNPKWVCMPDQFVGWFPFAVREGLRMVKQQKVDAIFSTSLPNTCHLVGYILQRRTGLPWVADFRDLWTQNTYYSYTRLVLAIENRMEAAVIRSADRITTINDPITQALRLKYANEPADKFLTIPHGFDPDDFATSRPTRQSSPDEFIITYTGSLTGLRRADTFMHALKDAIDTDAAFAQKSRVRFVGNIAPARALSSQLRLEATMFFSDMVTHDKAWEYLADSDVILFILGTGELDEKASTGKLFEYLAIDRPILALAPEGVASNIIRNANSGIVVNPNDREAIKHALLDLFHKWSNGNLEMNPKREVIAQYDITQLSARFAAILDELTATKT